MNNFKESQKVNEGFHILMQTANGYVDDYVGHTHDL